MSGDLLRDLKSVARDLSTTPLARIPARLDRVCFILSLTHQSYRSGLGAAPLARSIKVASLFKDFGYTVYFLADPHVPTFSEYISLVASRTENHFFFFQIGQGSAESTSSIIFDDADLADKDFVALINGNRKQSATTTLFSDFSKEDSIYCHPELFDTNTTLITCLGDPSKSAEGPDKFIEMFTRELDGKRNITNQQMFDSMRITIKRHQLQLSIKSGSEQQNAKKVAICEPSAEKNDLIR